MRKKKRSQHHEIPFSGYQQAHMIMFEYKMPNKGFQHWFKNIITAE